MVSMNMSWTALRLLIVWVMIPWATALWWSWRGWTILRQPNAKPVSLDLQLRLALLRRIRGEEAANRYREQLANPKVVQFEGYFSLVMGVGILIAGAFILQAWIDRFVHW